MPLLDYRFAFKIVEKKKKIEKKKGSLFSYPALQHRGGGKKKEALHILVLSEFICVSLRKTSPE